MDDFQQSAKQMRVRGTLMVGATFGIFLTIGNVWSQFLETAVEAMVPAQESVVITALLYASFATFVSILLLFCLIKVDRYVTSASKHVNRKNLRIVAEQIPGVRIVDEQQTTKSAQIPSQSAPKIGVTKQGQMRRSKQVSRSSVRTVQ